MISCFNVALYFYGSIWLLFCFENIRYADDFDEDIRGATNETYLEDDSYEHEEDEEEQSLIPEKQAWLYEQALRGRARQRAASQLQAVLRRWIDYILLFTDIIF